MVFMLLGCSRCHSCNGPGKVICGVGWLAECCGVGELKEGALQLRWLSCWGFERGSVLAWGQGHRPQTGVGCMCMLVSGDPRA